MTTSDASGEKRSQSARYRFGGFELDATRRTLSTIDGQAIALTSRVFDTLLYLVRNHHRVIGKDELMREIWPDTFVEENNLNKNISILRRLLGETRDEHRFIVTIAGRGYEFVADVEGPGHEGRDSAAGADPENAAATGPATPDPRPITPAGGAPTPGRTTTRSRWLSLALLAALLAGLGITAGLWRAARRPADAPIRTLAVLPFQSLAADDRDEALELGMADALINEISATEGIIVRPLSSVRRYHRPDRDPIEAGREVGADLVLEGTIQSSDGRTRVTARLVRTSDGRQIWTSSFDEESGHLFDLQDSISERAVAALTTTLGGDARRRPRKRGTDDIEAYQLYMKGRFHQSKLVLPEARKSAELFRQAIELDPDYALAHVGLSDAYRSFALSGDAEPRDALARASDAAARALAIDPELPEAQVASGAIHFWYEWNWAGTEQKYRRALQLDPNHPAAYLLGAHLSSTLGHGDEAIARGRRARELDPLSLIANSAEAQFLFFAGRSDEALARLDRTLELDPEFWHAHLVRALILIENEMYSEAVIAADRAARVSGGNTQALAAQGWALAKAGDVPGARRVLARLHEEATRRHVPASNLAMLHNALGESDEALSWLERGLAGRDPLMVFLGVDRRWDNLREHPRFQRVIERMRLE
jgi:DNA-binding winged helix-turn-helix (wHTH) protein/TolB-like protein/Tfp pilus assembly protein PilF